MTERPAFAPDWPDPNANVPSGWQNPYKQARRALLGAGRMCTVVPQGHSVSDALLLFHRRAAARR